MESSNWHKIKLGDKAAFMEMYDSHYQVLYAFGLRVRQERELVKDAIHEMFCEVWENREKLPDVLNEKAYLFTYLKRKILKSLSAEEYLVKGVEFGEGESVPSFESLLISNQTKEESLKILQNLLERISPTQREIIEYKYFLGMDYEKISAKLGISQRTVYNQVYEALKTMRANLKFLRITFILFAQFLLLK
ncbi:sigma-70 family RNA polymerase sigma factor [Pedobacter aquatilis]|uniref:RNA polymerase sigma factor n=1 Tax=Pedobacter aquatilis TaxID=351343 RepID=UPI002931F627|nr:sigma-70 family RNA polymerase sigma factor [Pedobacter aquatilis]